MSIQEKIILFPRRLCETLAGDLAHTVGRLAFRPGRPMLVEHVGGIFLEHDLAGRVMTEGYGHEYDIVHVWAEEAPPVIGNVKSFPVVPRKVFQQERSGCPH